MENAPPAPVVLGGKRRPTKGDFVVLSPDYASHSGASDGPLSPGDVGEIITDDHSGRPYDVRFNGKTWWYDEGAVQLTRRAPLVDAIGELVNDVGSLHLGGAPPVANDGCSGGPAGQDGLPVNAKAGVTAGVVAAAAHAWASDAWAKRIEDEAKQLPKHAARWHNANEEARLSGAAVEHAGHVVAWLRCALEASLGNGRLEAIVLRILANAGGTRYWDSDAECTAERERILEPLKSCVAKAQQTKQLLGPAWIAYAEEHKLAELFASISGPPALPRWRTRDGGERPAVAELLTQERYLPFMDPDLYVLVDHAAGRAGFTFTETSVGTMLGLAAQCLLEPFRAACAPLAGPAPAGDPTLKTLVELWRDAAPPRGARGIREDFQEWYCEEGYDQDVEELKAECSKVIETWPSHAKLGVVDGSWILDALRLRCVARTPKELLQIWARLPGLFPDVLKVSNSFRGEGGGASSGMHSILVHAVFDPKLDFAALLASPGLGEAVESTKRANPDDVEEVDGAVNMFEALLPHIGERPVAMVVQFELILEYYAEAKDRMPTAWSVVQQADTVSDMARLSAEALKRSEPPA